MDKSYIHNTILGISSFQNGPNHSLNLTDFYFKNKRTKLWKAVTTCKITMFFSCWPFFLKMYIFEVVTFFLPNAYLINSIFPLSNSCYNIIENATFFSVSIATIVKETNLFVTIIQLINLN